MFLAASDAVSLGLYYWHDQLLGSPCMNGPADSNYKETFSFFLLVKLLESKLLVQHSAELYCIAPVKGLQNMKRGLRRACR